MKRSHDIERWLAREILDRDIPRKPPGEARRTNNARLPEFRAWIREHPCAVCGSTYSVESAHVGRDGGMSIKATDEELIPLCHDCHQAAPGAYHRVGRRAFELRTGLDTRALAARLYAEWVKLNERRTA